MKDFLRGLGYCAIWCGLGVFVLSLGGCFYIAFRGDDANPAPLVSIHLHLK